MNKSGRVVVMASLVMTWTLSDTGTLPVGPSAAAQQASNDDAPIPHGQDRAPNAPRSAAEAVKAMTVPPGFQVEVVAAEPDIVNPVAMTFDERGRIWITESLEYPRRSPGPGRDRVKVLEDTDGDGRIDKISVFAEGLNIPSGIAVGHGGVWVANSPDILFLQDRDGDGKADSKEVVATGFGRSDTHELPNSLTWGPDGWLYGWNGVFNPGRVASRNGKIYRFTCAIFRIHPRTRVFEIWCEGTSNPWGIAIDPEGSFFASACVIDHLWHLVETGYYIRQGGPYPPFTWPMGSIVEHEHQKAAYCGIHYFDSPAYPPEYRDRLYMGNIHGNCINVDLLERNGSTYRSKPAPDFLSANDSWFMPVAQKTGPDGCLYVLDWYDRYHCYQDANRDPVGIDRLKGRLYRVRYGDTARKVGFDLAAKPDDELVGQLSSPNVYDRDIAQRLLTERASPATRHRLEAMVLDAATPYKGRMHALWVLIGSGQLDVGFHLKLLAHHEQALRAWGVRAAGNQGRVDPAILEQVGSRARDSSPEVRVQAAIAARKLEGADPVPLLLDSLSDSGDPLIPHVVWQNLHPLLETRQLEIARSIEQMPAGSVGLGPLAPRAIERILESSKANPDAIRLLLATTRRDQDTRNALDVLAARFREGDLSAEMQQIVRSELARRLNDAARGSGRELVPELRVLLCYFGDPDSVKETLEIARAIESGRGRPSTTGGAKDPGGGRDSLRKDQWLDSLDRRGHPRRGRRFQLDRVQEPGSGLPQSCRRPGAGAVPAQGIRRLAGRAEAKSRRAVDATHELDQGPALRHRRQGDPALGAQRHAAPQAPAQQGPRCRAQGQGSMGHGPRRPEPVRERVVSGIRKLVHATPGDPLAGQSVFRKLCARVPQDSR